MPLKVPKDFHLTFSVVVQLVPYITIWAEDVFETRCFADYLYFDRRNNGTHKIT